MTATGTGTVMITGPTRGLGRALTLEMAGRAELDRPDLLLIGRPGETLTEVAVAGRAAGATVHEIPCDLSRLADVRAAAATAQDLLATGAVRPLRALVANAGLATDTRAASADGYEMTFAVNYLAHAQLIGDLLGSFAAPARIVLLGSNVYRGTRILRMVGVPGPEWRDPVDLARPAPAETPANAHTAGVAYATSKLAILYCAHELQRRVADGIRVSVFEPGFMPGTGLGREQGPVVRAMMRALQRFPGMASPSSSAPALASIVLDDRWAHLRDGAFVVIDKETEVAPFAYDRDRELRLCEATADLLEKATPADA
ncbi:MAG: SDR family NAD(P)-dependent oxidoreductase [Streptosporangiaceae bacterium]